MRAVRPLAHAYLGLHELFEVGEIAQGIQELCQICGVALRSSMSCPSLENAHAHFQEDDVPLSAFTGCYVHCWPSRSTAAIHDAGEIEDAQPQRVLDNHLDHARESWRGLRKS